MPFITGYASLNQTQQAAYKNCIKNQKITPECESMFSGLGDKQKKEVLEKNQGVFNKPEPEQSGLIGKGIAFGRQLMDKAKTFISPNK